jgi:hypothetical protein
MSLRLVAHYFDPVEAMIARSVIEAAGMLAILDNYYWISVQPHHVGPLGGYRLVVSESDLEDAVSVLTEACSNPSTEGGRLEVSGDLLDRVLSYAVGMFAGGAPMPIRQRRWLE